MSITGDFIRILAQAIDIAGDAFGTPKAVLVRQGLDKTTAAAVVKIGTIYFGSTNAPRMQERARDAGHTFRSLQAIESQVAKLEKKAYAWRLREELVPLGPDITRINAEGARLLQELNTHHADNPDKKLTYRSITNSTYATLTLTAESSRVKQIYDRARATDKDCPANGLIRLALAANDGKLSAAATPCLLVPLDMSFSGFTEEERGKFRFSLTNGATISGEEIVHPYAPQNFGETVWRGWRRCVIWLLMSHSLDFCTASVGCLWLFFRCVSSARGKQGSEVSVYSSYKDRILLLVHLHREVVEPDGSAPDALTPRAYHQCSTSPQSKNNSM